MWLKFWFCCGESSTVLPSKFDGHPTKAFRVLVDVLSIISFCKIYTAENTGQVSLKVSIQSIIFMPSSSTLLSIFYCNSIGRFLSENVAALAGVTSDVNAQSGISLTNIVDALRETYFTSWQTQKDRTKRITISLGSDYNVAMILIANAVEYLNELIDFKIAVGK